MIHGVVGAYSVYGGITWPIQCQSKRIKQEEKYRRLHGLGVIDLTNAV